MACGDVGAVAFAAKNGYEVNGDQELVALGLADIFNGFFQGFAVTGSQSRTAVNDAAGGRTQVAGLVAAVTLALFLLMGFAVIPALKRKYFIAPFWLLALFPGLFILVAVNIAGIAAWDDFGETPPYPCD